MSDKSMPANIGPVVSGKAVELLIKFAEFGLNADGNFAIAKIVARAFLVDSGC